MGIVNRYRNAKLSNAVLSNALVKAGVKRPSNSYRSTTASNGLLASIIQSRLMGANILRYPFEVVWGLLSS